MSKVEIVGPRQLLGETLSLVRKEGDLHIEPSAVGFIDDIHKKEVHLLLPDEKALFEKIFLEELEGKLKTLFYCLAVDTMRESFLSPRPIIDTVSKTLDKHLQMCQVLCKKREEIRHDLFELSGYRTFLATVSTLIDKIQLTPGLDYIGITLKDEKSVSALKKNLDCLADSSCELLTVPSEDGSLVGLIAATKDISEDIRSMMSEKQMPEFTFPESIRSMTFAHKVEYLQEQIRNNEAALAAVDARLTEFTHRWGPMYKAAQDWVHEQLSIIQASAFSFETTMCFFIYGWMPSKKVAGLSACLQQQFAGSVMLEEIDIRMEDLERVPVVLKNPQYFKPFENFTRLLPLPSYTSFDPTPFIGLFFPLFFGLILGDTGYGLILLIASVLLSRVARKNLLFQDAIRILKVCSLYAIIFGFLYAEKHHTNAVFCPGRWTGPYNSGTYFGNHQCPKETYKERGTGKTFKHNSNFYYYCTYHYIFRDFSGIIDATAGYYYPDFNSSPALFRRSSRPPRTAQKYRQYNFLCQDHGYRAYICIISQCSQPAFRSDR
jgi:V/A-type H+-transporting ATPase subunit I